jgi:hypothetical protein
MSSTTTPGANNALSLGLECHLIRYVRFNHLPSIPGQFIKSASVQLDHCKPPKSLSVWLYETNNVRHIRNTDPKLNQFTHYSSLTVEEYLDLGKQYGTTIRVFPDPNGTSTPVLSKWHYGVSGILTRPVRDALLAAMTRHIQPVP